MIILDMTRSSQLTKDAVQKLRNSATAKTTLEPSQEQEVQKEPDPLIDRDLWQPFVELKLGSVNEEERHKAELTRIEESYEAQERKLEETNLHMIELVSRLDSVKSDPSVQGRKGQVENPQAIQLMEKIKSCYESNSGRTLHCSPLVHDYLVYMNNI